MRVLYIDQSPWDKVCARTIQGDNSASKHLVLQNGDVTKSRKKIGYNNVKKLAFFAFLMIQVKEDCLLIFGHILVCLNVQLQNKLIEFAKRSGIVSFQKGPTFCYLLHKSFQPTQRETNSTQMLTLQILVTLTYCTGWKFFFRLTQVC